MSVKIEPKRVLGSEEEKAREERERVEKVLKELLKELPLTIKQFGKEFEKRTGCELAYHEFSTQIAHLNAIRIKVSDTEIVMETNEENWIAYCNHATVGLRIRAVLMITPFKEAILWYDYNMS